MVQPRQHHPSLGQHHHQRPHRYPPLVSRIHPSGPRRSRTSSAALYRLFLRLWAHAHRSPRLVSLNAGRRRSSLPHRQHQHLDALLHDARNYVNLVQVCSHSSSLVMLTIVLTTLPIASSWGCEFHLSETETNYLVTDPLSRLSLSQLERLVSSSSS